MSGQIQSSFLRGRPAQMQKKKAAGRVAHRPKSSMMFNSWCICPVVAYLLCVLEIACLICVNCF